MPKNSVGTGACRNTTAATVPLPRSAGEAAALLGLAAGAAPADVDRAYREQVSRCHPDRVAGVDYGRETVYGEDPAAQARWWAEALGVPVAGEEDGVAWVAPDSCPRIEFVPDPVCWTEAPESARVLSRQRRRWQRGLAETLWRHKAMFGRPRYGAMGLIALPYFVLFELVGPVIQTISFVVLPLAYLLGVEGLALVRAWAGDYDEAFVRARLAEVRRL